MSYPIAVRGFISGVLQFEDMIDADTTDLEALAERHALAILSLPGGEKHMIEVEFLEEPDETQRFFRFGTDPGGMVLPMAVNIDEDRASGQEPPAGGSPQAED